MEKRRRLRAGRKSENIGDEVFVRHQYIIIVSVVRIMVKVLLKQSSNLFKQSSYT